MPDTDSTRSVLLTGATGGVGLAATRALTERGLRVYAGYRSDPGALKAVAAEYPARVQPIRLDVTDAESVEAAADEVRARTGGALHGVVNNAGIIVQGPMELVPDEELRRQFAINVFGPALVTRAFLPLLRRGRGRVVNVTAGTARVAAPFFGPISMSKAALASYSDALRVELAPWGVPVVVVEPGAMATEIFSRADRAARKAMAAQPAERVALYGRQLEVFEAALGAMKPGSPALAADAIVRALTDARPRPRYSVGSDLRGIGLLAALPLRTRDRLVTRVLGLSKLPPAEAEPVG